MAVTSGLPIEGGFSSFLLTVCPFAPTPGLGYTFEADAEHSAGHQEAFTNK